MSGLADLLAIIAKYSSAGIQKGLKEEMVALAQALHDPMPRAALPVLQWIDNATVRVNAAADSPAKFMASGFPDIYNPSACISAGLSNGDYLEIVAPASLAMGSDLWGNEKSSQWYAALAVDDGSGGFALQGMPYCRVKSQAVKTISLGTHIDPATGIGYGFATDSLAGYYLYILSGDSKGLAREVTANNNNNTTGGTITYTGDALTLAAGDWFIILPNDNFRWIDDFYNNDSGNIADLSSTGNLLFGKEKYIWTAAGTYPWFCPLTWPVANSSRATGIGGGAGGTNGSGVGGNGGGAGARAVKQLISPVPGTYYLITVGAKGAAGAVGNVSSIGALLTLAGGALNWTTGNKVTDEVTTLLYISGAGQDGLFGGGGPAMLTTSAVQGKDGNGSGSGGSGGVGTDGGAGADGYMEICKERIDA